MARKIKKSDIWQKKPSWWLKVWNYMLMQVNHKDNSQFKRGQNFFTREQIHDDCKLYLDGIKAVTVDNVVRWLRSTTQITTQKTTRGIIITICNYELYQSLKNYKNDAENDTSHEIKTRQERDRNDTINKNDKNDKNEINTISKEFFDYFLLKTKKDFKLTPERIEIIKKRLKDGFTYEQLRQAVDNFVQDDWEGRAKLMDLVYCIGIRNKIDNLEKWLNYKPKVKPEIKIEKLQPINEEEHKKVSELIHETVKKMGKAT